MYVYMSLSLSLYIYIYIYIVLFVWALLVDTPLICRLIKATTQVLVVNTKHMECVTCQVLHHQ